MIPWLSGSDSARDTGDGEARQAKEVQEEKLRETLMTVSDVQEAAARSRRLLETDLLAIAIERSMRRA